MKRVKYNNKFFKIIDSCSFKFSNNEVTFNDIIIDFTGYSLADIPLKYQEIKVVEIDDNNSNNEYILFTGYLDSIEISTMKKKKEFRELTLTLLSPLKMATVRTVSLIGTYSINEAITRIMQPLIDDGFVIKEINVGEGQITTNFVLETIENCMNNVCSKRNIFWYINARKEIYINLIDCLFGKSISKIISENDVQRETGLLSINPTIENVDYANIINFKNIRLIYHQSNNDLDENNKTNGYPIISIDKQVKKGDVITFDNPIIVDENVLRNVMSEELENEEYVDIGQSFNCLQLNISSTSSTDVYTIGINRISGNENYDKYVIGEEISFSDDKEEKDIVLQRDSFFNNLITGFKWNKDVEATISLIESYTALRYTTMKFVYTAEIESLKNVVSESGQIEKTIDYGEKWTTLNQLINYARSLIIQNSNVINSIELEYDKNPNLNIGDIVRIEMPSFFSEGNYAVKEIEYTYKNKTEQNWKIVLKSSDLISTYIDMFRPQETEENEDKIDTVILGEFVEENIKEIHTVSIVEEESS